MSDLVDWVFHYPHRDFEATKFVATAYPYYGRIDTLWNRVKDVNPNLAIHVDKAEVTFYLPSNLSLEPFATLRSRSQQWLQAHRFDGLRAEGVQVVNTFFPNEPNPRLVHALVVTPEVLASLDYLGDLEGLTLYRRKRNIELLQLPSPSAGVNNAPDVWHTIINCANNFHIGRPAQNYGPPVSLFNHALGLFDYQLRHLDDDPSVSVPTPDLIELARSLMIVAANNHQNGFARAAETKAILSSIFTVSLDWDFQFGIKPDAINSVKTPFIVVEIKNEVGLEGDAFMQAALSYAHIVKSLANTDPFKLTNYPAILCGIMGNVLEIGIATYTDGLYCNLVFSERLLFDFHAAKNLLHLSRAFMATRCVISDLEKFYAHLEPRTPGSLTIAHLFPSPLPVPTYTGPVPSLTFTHRLSRAGETFVMAEDEASRQSGLYLATMPRPRSADEAVAMSSSVDAPSDTIVVVVKFTAQYHPEAHALLAAEGFAPVLHACVPVCGGLFMVVMDLVCGTTAWSALAKPRKLLPYSIYKDIQGAIALLHSKDLVFGDLRAPNIMIVSGRSGSDDQCRGMLVDFDFVGTHGVGRYPTSLNRLPEWASTGIEPYGIMEKVHDLVLLNKFKDGCRSV